LHLAHIGEICAKHTVCAWHFVARLAHYWQSER